ncbi:ATP-binding cassette domain-containing protein [Corynebacterium striatum]
MFSRIFEYLDLEPELTEATEPAQLADASLTIPAHTTTALVGHTGSGKSTVATLLARPADPTEGAVLLDGVDLRDIPPEQRAEAISVVSQETYLIHGTVWENLLFAQPGASDEQMRAVLNAARVDGVIAALPEGLDTVVGSRDYRFSGGERQRLSLARTLLRRPRNL